MNGRSWHVTGAVVLAVLMGAEMPAGAQESCPQGERPFAELLEESAREVLPEATAALRRATAVAVVTQPPAAPASRKIEAPSATGAGTDLVDGALFPDLLGLALSRSFDELGTSPVTLDLNPFALAVLANREALWNDEVYQRRAYTLLRRFSAAITTGGTGVAFDRDGDGDVDEALAAREIGDIVTWEARGRLTRGRDRREAYNAEVFFDQLGDGEDLVNGVHERAREILTLEGAPLPRSGSCTEVREWNDFVAQPHVRERILELAKAGAQLERLHEEAAEVVDNRPVLSLIVGGVDRDEQFGPDVRYYALRGSWRGGTANLEYRRIAGLADAPDPTTLKLGLEWAWLWWESRGTFSISGAFERSEDVPDAAHDEIAKVGVKLEYEVAKGIKLPVSVTWANHEDLLTDADEVVGHIGFTLDASQLSQVVSRVVASR